MTHKIKVSAYECDTVEDLLELADLDYTVKDKGYDVCYYIEGKTSKYMQLCRVLKHQSIRFESDLMHG
jgi:hypothetical protein